MATRLTEKPVGTAAESLLVLKCATTILTADARRDIEVLLSRPLDWKTVVGLARRNRILSLLYLNLHRVKSPATPAPILAELRGYFMRNTARSLQLSGEVLRLLDVFEKNAIPVAPFKGVVLASSVYGDPALRDSGDIDVLVHRGDIVRAADLLGSLGHRPFYPTATDKEAAYLSSLTGGRRAAYLQYHGEHHLVREDRLNIDLHWRVSHRDISRGLDSKTLWAGLMPIQLGGRVVQTFCPEHLLIVLCDNGAKDGWNRLDRVCDVAELLRRNPSLNWSMIRSTCRRIGALRLLLLGLSLAVDLLDAPLPDDMRAQLQQNGAIIDLAAQIRVNLLDPDGGFAGKLSLSLMHFQLADSWVGRLRYCRMQLASNVGEWMLIPLPSRLWFLYSVIRPIRLMGRFMVKRLRSLGRRSREVPKVV